MTTSQLTNNIYIMHIQCMHMTQVTRSQARKEWFSPKQDVYGERNNTWYCTASELVEYHLYAHDMSTDTSKLEFQKFLYMSETTENQLNCSGYCFSLHTNII